MSESLMRNFRFLLLALLWADTGYLWARILEDGGFYLVTTTGVWLGMGVAIPAAVLKSALAAWFTLRAIDPLAFRLVLSEAFLGFGVTVIDLWKLTFADCECTPKVEGLELKLAIKATVLGAFLLVWLANRRGLYE